MTLPFCTSLISAHFEDTAAIFLYCLNTLFLTIYQNQIWDYVAVRPEFLSDDLTAELNYKKRVAFNVAMIDAIFACGLSFISPLAAFITLAIRYPLIKLAGKIFVYKPKQIE